MFGIPVPTSVPKSKVLAATSGSAVGSAVAMMLLWVLQSFKITLPAEMSDALSVLITSGVAFVSGYFMPPAASEANVVQQDGTVRSATVAPATAGA